MPLWHFSLWNINTICYIFFLLQARGAVKLDLGLAAFTTLWLIDQVENGNLVPIPVVYGIFYVSKEKLGFLRFAFPSIFPRNECVFHKADTLILEYSWDLR